ncbi:uncharacterized protein PHALS_10087 [Plasmopara halstedii]|uniref:Uncharacterized protein n=1 Tax=Plasmopara halstedii TaxID=4781 RepID=A0A0P1AGP2_PLAHL|nr:uncharacterized protein PHALS_10087 [Plasmopara halstedii]CEG39856.1 hypothetical protein PHALS_10087 [Plasmopara halstedii]|eukprot:XP_024576225.1 hypothetical protein PHALS_10087 [Plasmopara halstedii]
MILETERHFENVARTLSSLSRKTLIAIICKSSASYTLIFDMLLKTDIRQQCVQ